MIKDNEIAICCTGGLQHIVLGFYYPTLNIKFINSECVEKEMDYINAYIKTMKASLYRKDETGYSVVFDETLVSAEYGRYWVDKLIVPLSVHFFGLATGDPNVRTAPFPY